MIRKTNIIFLLVLLTACAPSLQTQPTATPSLVPVNTDVEAENASDEPAQAAKISNETYLLTAAFHWVDTNTTTDIMYSYQIPFVIQPNGQLKAAGEPMGAGIGDAGVRMDDCVEAKPVTMEFSFVLKGRKMESSVDRIDPDVILNTALDLTNPEQLSVFDIALVTPKITSFELEPFTSCMQDIDQEFAEALLTIWLTILPDLPEKYHLIPAEIGTFCATPISFVEEGLGELTPCYTIREVQ